MMSIYLKHIIDALQTLIITRTTDISNNSAISIITSGKRYKIYGIIDTQPLEIKLNK